EPHTAFITSDLLQRICKPVSIPWPGIRWTDAADVLGRHHESIRAWMKHGGLLRRRNVAPSIVGCRGRPVPMVWTESPIDPNADGARPPDAVWGTLWQYLYKRIPDNLEFAIKRVPILQSYNGYRPRFRGWQFVCPGLPCSLSTPASSPAPGGGGGRGS